MHVPDAGVRASADRVGAGRTAACVGFGSPGKRVPATRIPAVAAGWNERVVVVEWEAPGGRRSVVVWRNAVTPTGLTRQAATAPVVPR